jgi:preprotein translocase subunit SecD
MSLVAYLKDRRIYTLIIIIAALLLLDAYYGLHGGIHLGVEFAGGTQIPVTLDHGVNTTEMADIVATLQARVSKFGLSEVTVEGVGNSTVYVIIPSVSEQEINQTVGIIKSQGNFEGVVNGAEAINGSGILKGSVEAVPPQQVNNSVSWQVSFYISPQAAQQFSVAAFGQANQPLHLFLDRPTSAIVLVDSAILNKLGTGSSSSFGVSAAQGLSDMQSALQLGNRTIPVLAVSNTTVSIQKTESYLSENRYKYSQVIATPNLNSGLLAAISNHSLGNYTLKLVNQSQMSPTIAQISTQESTVSIWPAVGLLSSPVLEPGVTNGNSSTNYEISGASPTNISITEQLAYAQNQTKTITSILTGGALPVAVIVGTPSVTPPTLGSNFLYVSIVALVLCVIAISIFIMIRYRKLFLVAPILLTTFMELFIIFSIIGLVGTIDLSAVAGMIAILGTGVDSQIIITDEMLKKGSHESSGRTILGNAFYIVWIDAALLVFAMLPLFFSTSLVTVIGFSESTIIGAILGVLITRPAYGAIISRHYA